MAKITEFCNRVAYVEASYYHGWSSHGECRVVEFEAITTDGKIITTSIKGDDVDDAIKVFVMQTFLVIDISSQERITSSLIRLIVTVVMREGPIRSSYIQ